MNSSTTTISIPPAATAPAGHAFHAQARGGQVGDIGGILNNPMQLRMLAERVYTLLVQDLRLQSERVGNYGARF
jgi:hypothetical protein